jgi:putative hydrolase of the HAD superfamily
VADVLNGIGEALPAARPPGRPAARPARPARPPGPAASRSGHGGIAIRPRDTGSHHTGDHLRYGRRGCGDRASYSAGVTSTAPVSAILLDAGGVLLFPEPELTLPLLRAAGLSPDLVTLERAHYQAMLGQDLAATPPTPDTWRHDYLLSYLTACGVAEAQRSALAAELVPAFTGTSWAHVGTGTVDGLRALAALGLPLGIVSNSDGTVQAQLRQAGVCYVPDAPRETAESASDGAGVPVGVIVDSAVVGVAKPDPAIFRIALDALGVPASNTVLYVGDSLRYDVAGAIAAGLRPVHFDPYGYCPAPEGHRHVSSLAALAAEIEVQPEV